MAGTFGGLSTALSALYAQRRGMENAGQNIANANTEGYSRQRVGMVALGAPVQSAIFSVGDPIGGGVKISDVTRFRDEFLESRTRSERASNSYLTERKGIYTRIEQIIGEPSDTGIQSQLAEYWSAWHDLANRPGDGAARTQLLQRGTTLTDSVRDAYSNFDSLWESTREQLDAHVVEINTAAVTVAQLNEAVIRTKQAGLPGNELADQRDLAVLKLAELTGGTAIPKENGAIDFAIFGSSLVSGANSRKIEAFGATQLAEQGGDPVGVRWTDTKVPVILPSGKIAATLESLGTTIPDTIKDIDSVVSELKTSVNTQHAAGFDLKGDAGGDFFTGTGAKDFAVAFTDPDLIAAAGSAPVPPATKTLDGSNADLIAGLVNSSTGPDNKYRQFVVELGVAAQSTYRRADIQQAITNDIDVSRTSESGVNLDEEMMNLVAYQQAYAAAAKVISVIDASLETLMNSLRR